MVLGWRRAFCTTIPKDHQRRDSPIIKEKPDPNPSPRLRSRLGGIFSNPSTPKADSSPKFLRCKTGLVSTQRSDVSSNDGNDSAPQSPKLRCRTSNGNNNNNNNSSPRLLLFSRSTPSSPRSPSAFSLLKSTIRLSKSRCGICVQHMKTGQGTAIFTAECGHVFHFPCIVVHVKKQSTLTCPVCGSPWKEMHLLNNSGSVSSNIDPASTFHSDRIEQRVEAESHSPHVPSSNKKSVLLKVYNDDEPLNSPTCGARFNAIPESEEEDEFPGFFVCDKRSVMNRDVDEANDEDNSAVVFQVLSEAAVVSVGKTSETYAVVLKIRAPSASVMRRAPIDLVMVANVSSSVITAEKLHVMKKCMRAVVSSLSSSDRLSLVAFSTASKRLLPLRRMTASGKRSSRRIIDAVVTLDGAAASAIDSLKKAAKVVEDRREKNPTTAVIFFSDGGLQGEPPVSSTRFSNLEIPVHTVSLSACLHEPDLFTERASSLLCQAVHDLRVRLSLVSGSGPGEISAVYSYTGRPVFVGSGSGWLRVGNLGSDEERELLIELKVPSSMGGAQRMLSVRYSCKDPSTRRETLYNDGDARPLVIPRARENQRLRCLFVATRAVAEGRRLAERDDVAGAHHILAAARALVRSSGWNSGEEFVRGLDAELAQLSCKRRNIITGSKEDKVEAVGGVAAEPLTPTSAWRAAERLAKVAIMRKSLNRVSDLHGFENARF